MTVTKLIVCLFAGLGAGLGTGFAGMSAAAVIAPMLIAFLDMDPYLAVGIALASDILASAGSAITYAKNKNIDIKHGLVMMLAVLLFTVVGSWVASLIRDNLMGNFSMAMTVILGLRFIIFPVDNTKENLDKKTTLVKILEAFFCGSIVGFICGFVGAGGGMMMLLLLTSVMGFELKKAVGTSVFIMAATAFTGSVSHFVIGGLPDLWCLGLCVVFTLVFALLAAKIANRVEAEKLNRILGIVLVALGVSMFIVDIARGKIPVELPADFGALIY